jgi:seryl-tRNA synthetase
LLNTSQRGRGEDESIVDALIEIDAKRREAISAFETVRAETESVFQ